MLGKTPGQQPASLQVHGDITTIMGLLDVLDSLEQRFLAAAQWRGLRPSSSTLMRAADSSWTHLVRRLVFCILLGRNF